MSRVLIEGGRVLDPGQKVDQDFDVYIADGKVALMGNQLRGRLPMDGVRVIDAKGLWVMPGLVDVHVHLREPGREEDETIRSGTRAAARGGVTTVLCMPNTVPPLDDAEKVRWVQQRAKETAKVRVMVSGAVSQGQLGNELAPLPSMAREGVRAFTDDGRAVATAELMRRALEIGRDLELPIIEHCEDPTLSGGGCMHEGPVSFRWGVKGIPSSSEAVIAVRDIELVRQTGGSLHLAHISCRETVQALRRAKEDGLPVTGEVCPHHFTLSDSDMPMWDTNYKMNPPLRAEEDVTALQKALADGVIDVVATDHAPHSSVRKNVFFEDAPFGVVGLESLVPLSLALVRKGIITPLRWAELVTSAPARLLGLKDRGSLRVGAVADVTLIHPEMEHSGQPVESRSRNTPFGAHNLKGQAVMTLVGGQVVMEAGKILDG